MPSDRLLSDNISLYLLLHEYESLKPQLRKYTKERTQQYEQCTLTINVFIPLGISLFETA